MKKRLENFLLKLNPELFAFSFSLVPDDLQAEQLILDSVDILFVEGKSQLKSLLAGEQGSERAIKKFLFQKILGLGRKRYAQLSRSLEPVDQFAPFYQLETVNRGILFLQHKTDFDFEEIEEITNIFRHEIISHLASSRQHLIQSSGYEFELKAFE